MAIAIVGLFLAVIGVLGGCFAFDCGCGGLFGWRGICGL